MTKLQKKYLSPVARLGFVMHTEPGSVCEELEKLETLRGIQSQLITLGYRIIPELKEQRELILERIATANGSDTILLSDMLTEIDKSISKLEIKIKPL